MSHMNDRATFQYINTVDPVDWSVQSEYVHDDYKWKISPDSLECTTYHHKKPIRYSLGLNQLMDGSSSSSRVLTQSVTTIPRYLIVDNDFIYMPVGTTWAQIMVDNCVKAIAVTTYNNIVKISMQCTFHCNIPLPVGLPLFNGTVDKVIGFVGRQLPNGWYTVDAASNQKITKHIMTNEKINIHFINLTYSKQQPVTRSQKRVAVYGNMLCEKGISTSKIRHLEARLNDNDQEKRINVIQKDDGVLINVTNGTNEEADELESFSFMNTKFKKYFVLPPIEEFVVDEEQKIIVKNKKHKK